MYICILSPDVESFAWKLSRGQLVALRRASRSSSEEEHPLTRYGARPLTLGLENFADLKPVERRGGQKDGDESPNVLTCQLGVQFIRVGASGLRSLGRKTAVHDPRGAEPLPLKSSVQRGAKV